MNVQKENIIEHAFSLGLEYEKKITCCCQCTIAAIQDALEVRNDAVFKAGSGLTAGGGLSCEGSCGGFTGGVMVMSSVFGRRRGKWDADRKDKDCAHRMARALLAKFNQEYGGSLCKTVHHSIFGREFDLLDIPDREAFEKLGAHVDKCTSVVGKAAAWATELILEELSNRGMSLKDLQGIKEFAAPVPGFEQGRRLS
jgi:C_GCAxxG_C_C family probable redox protein